MKNKTLVIGDSFLNGAEHFETHWLNKLSNLHDLKLVNYSVSGTGPLFVIDKFLELEKQDKFKQFKHFIFSWSEATRFYHPAAPHINIHESRVKHHYQKGLKKIYKAASLWYEYLMVSRLECLKTEALMFWFDFYLKKNYPNVKVWHFSSWASNPNFSIEVLKNLEEPLPHVFEKGVNVCPTLISLSLYGYLDASRHEYDTRIGHLEEWKHNFVYESLKDINNYSDGEILKMPLQNIEDYNE